MYASSARVYPQIGIMPMPLNFKYREVIQLGRPRHDRFDNFTIKHPPMSVGQWAKIFSPFDALDGFDERIAEKEVLYESQAEISEDDQAELDRQLNILHNLTWNSRMARQNHVAVTVRYFVPCSDQNHFSFGIGGKYKTVTGMVLRAEMGILCLRTDVGEKKIAFSSIRKITGTVFDTDWELESP